MLLGLIAAASAGLAGDVGAALYLLLAEVLALLGISAEVALERHSRSGVMALAEQAGRKDGVEARLLRTPTYEITARLMRFLGTAMLVVGIAYLAFRDRFGTGTEDNGAIPWTTFGVVLALLFLLTFLVNAVLVHLLVRRPPNRALLTLLPALEVMRYLLAPLRLPLVLFVRLVFREDLDAPSPTAREEILETVEEGEREGSFTAEEADMIESIIEMDKTVVKDVQTPRVDVVMIQADLELEAAIQRVNDDGYSRVPVFGKDRDDVIGVLYARDLLSYWCSGSDPTRPAVTVRDVMRKPFFVPENKPLNALLNEMRARKVHMAVVLDEFNGTSGLVTIEDLLEEIVGEIEDEYDEDEDQDAISGDAAQGTLQVAGRTPIEEVNEHLAVKLPIEEDFETLGGLVFHRLGRVPATGETLRIDGVLITVLEADERTALSLRIEVRSDTP